MKYFEVVNGRLVKIRPWPKRLTKKRALQLSIRKWKALVDAGFLYLADAEDGSYLTCALCYLYIDSDCSGCPIADYVDDTGCDGTPYETRQGENPQKELDFLKEVYLDKYGEEYPQEKD